MKNKIENLYKRAVNYIEGITDDTAHNIINYACDVLADNEDLRELYGRCCFHINMWNDNTFEEQIAEGDEIIEEISGTLGEYLA